MKAGAPPKVKSVLLLFQSDPKIVNAAKALVSSKAAKNEAAAKDQVGICGWVGGWVGGSMNCWGVKRSMNR